MTANHKIERLPKNRVQCTVTIDEQQYAPAEQNALQAFAAQVNVQGFRPGHAPADMVRAKVPPEQLFEETVRMLLRTVLPTLIKDNDLKPVIPPKVEVASRMPLVLQVTFVERPEVKVKNIDKLTIPKKELKADEKDIQKVIDSVLQEHRTFTEVERVSQTGDQVTIDFHATDEEGKEIEGMKAIGYGATIGSASLLPGFEEKLTGLKKGETTSFALTIPDNFQAEHLRGKKATFHVNVQKIEEVILPELTDAFAKEKLGSDSVQAFREMVTTSIAQQEEQFMRYQRERELMDLIRKSTQAEIADELLDEEVRGMIDDWAQQLEKQGMTIAQALEKQGKKPEEVEKEMRAQAEDRWKLRLGIAKVIEEKKLELSEEELQQGFDTFLANLPDNKQQQAKDEWQKRGTLFDEIRWRTLVDKLINTLLG